MREAGVEASGRPFSGSGLDLHGLYALAGQTRAAPTLALVKALLIAQTKTPTLSFDQIPEEELAERNRGKQRRSDSRDRGDPNRGGGKNVGGGDQHHCLRG